MFELSILTDAAPTDPSIFALKAQFEQVLQRDFVPNLILIREKNNLLEGAYLLKNALFFAQKPTLFLVNMGIWELQNKFLCQKIAQHWLVAPDSGIFSFLENASVHIFEVPTNCADPRAGALAFCADICSGKTPQALQETSAQKQLLMRQPFVNIEKKMVKGHVIYIDSFGHLITNLKASDWAIFDPIIPEIVFAGESVMGISDDADVYQGGDVFAWINQMGNLSIGICQGNAASLLSMTYLSEVVLYFE